MSAALASIHGRLAPYLANHRGQIEEYEHNWKTLYPGLEIVPTAHIAGTRNISDLGTRGLAEMEQVSIGSEWQSGPSFLQLDSSLWPLTDPPAAEVPAEEILPKHRQIGTVSITRLQSLKNTVKEIFNYSNNYTKGLRILA